MISITGIEHALRTVNRFTDTDRKLQEIARRLCEVGRQIAAGGFGSHASVTTEPTTNGYKIVISGEEVLFIEFGTGDAAGIHAAQYDAVPSVVYPGSWSETHSHQYEMLGFWFWHNQKFTETPPHPYTYDAYRAMVDALPQIAREVFAQ